MPRRPAETSRALTRLHQNVRRLLEQLPQDPEQAEAPLLNLSRFVVGLGVACDSVANRVPVFFSDCQVTRYRGRSPEEQRLAELERLGVQAHLLGQEGLGITNQAHLDDYKKRLGDLLDRLDRTFAAPTPVPVPRQRSVA